MSDREAPAARLHRFGAHSVVEDFVWVKGLARERLAQLPEICGCWCHSTNGHHNECECVSGKVYPAELVERLKQGTTFPTAMVVMFLDALNGETP